VFFTLPYTPSSPFASPFIWAWHPTFSTCFGSSKARSSVHWVPFSCTGYPVHDSDCSRRLDCCLVGPLIPLLDFHSMDLFATPHTSSLLFQGVLFQGSSRLQHPPQFRDRTLDLYHLTRLFGAILLIQSPACYYLSLDVFQLSNSPVARTLYNVPILSAPVSPSCTTHYHDIYQHSSSEPMLLLPLFDAFTTFPSRYHATLDFALFLLIIGAFS
jgi:hypothetical protein